jgi:hypothetical protein
MRKEGMKFKERKGGEGEKTKRVGSKTHRIVTRD